MISTLRHLVLLLSVFLGAVCLFVPAFAQSGEPRLLAKYGDWEAYMFIENGSKVCYMISEPKSKKGNYSRRGEVYALITHRPSEGSRDVFSYITGYTYKDDSEAVLDINGKAYSLFTQGETAWSYDSAMDKTIAKAIRDGVTMVVKGTSSRGTLTTDRFSLKGSSKAYDLISNEC